MTYTSDRTGVNIDKVLDINDGYTTTTALIASTNTGISAGHVLKTNGYTTTGDGGAAEWKYTGNTITASRTPAQTGTGTCSDADGKEFQIVVTGRLNTVALGLIAETNDGLTSALNNSPAIQAAHDFLANSGGGEADLPKGKIGFGTELILGEGAPVMFYGKGRGNIRNSAIAFRSSAGTRLVWTGASGNGIRFTSDRNNDGTKNLQSGGGLIDVMIDGDEAGDVGLQVVTHNGQKLKVLLCYWTDLFFKSDVLSNGVLNGPSDNQKFSWDIHTGDVNTSNEPNAHIVFHGDGVGNTSLGTIEELRIVAESAAPAVHFGECDGLTVNKLTATTRAASSGDGGKVFLHSDDSLPAYAGSLNAGYARNIVIVNSECVKGIVAKGITTGTNESGPNIILGLGKGNGSPDPTIETGADLSYITDKGHAYLKGLIKQVIADSTTNADIGFLNKGTESLRLVNGSSNQMVLESSDELSAWGINIDSTTGDLRFTRSTGSGNIILTRQLELTNQTTSSSASTGGATALPANPAGYVEWEVNGTVRKFGFYNP